MTDIPIIMSAPMVRALIDGRKTVTRRLAWHQVKLKAGGSVLKHSTWMNIEAGDRLWVRENWMPAIDAGGSNRRYAADYDADGVQTMRDLQPWRPSIHLPRVASRLTLIVTATKIEPLQDISEDDARGEGVEPRVAGQDELGPLKRFRTGFVYLWGALHGTDSWLSNPDVVAISFRPVLSNIDSLPKQEAA